MRRKQNIQDAFKSIVPQYEAGVWSVGYSGHTDESYLLEDYAIPFGTNGITIEITNISNITDKYVPGTTDLVMNDVYVTYNVFSGSTIFLSGVTESIYFYPTTTTTTTVAPTTTTTAAPTTTTTTT